MNVAELGIEGPGDECTDEIDFIFPDETDHCKNEGQHRDSNFTRGLQSHALCSGNHPRDVFREGTCSTVCLIELMTEVVIGDDRQSPRIT